MKKHTWKGKSLCFLLICIFFIVSCISKDSKYKNFDSTINIEFANNYFSIYLNRNGNAYVVRGNLVDSIKTGNKIPLDSSDIFHIDSIENYFKGIDSVSKVQQIITRGYGQKAEIFLNTKKVYETYASRKEFWIIFRPIIMEIPRNYYPFNTATFTPD